MIVPAYPGRVVPPEILYGSEIRHGIFGGYIVVQGFFWVLFEALGIFTPTPPPLLDHPCLFKSGIPPPLGA